MRLSRTTALCLGWLLSLAAGGVSATLPMMLGGAGTGAVFFALPNTFGSWLLQQRLELPDDELQILGAERYWRSQYRCQQTQRNLVVTLAAGPAGRIAAHSPEICYASCDYQTLPTARTVRIDGVEGQFWFHSFRPRTAGQPTLTVAYAWHDGHCWRAPRSPRWELFGSRRICRLQVACQHPEWETADAAAALTDFLHHALAGIHGQHDPGLTPTASVADGTARAAEASPARRWQVQRSRRW